MALENTENIAEIIADNSGDMEKEIAKANTKEISKEITIEEIQELDKASYLIVDIRDEVEISHGAIPGAVAVQADRLMPEHLAETAGEIFPADEYFPDDGSPRKKLIICCTH